MFTSMILMLMTFLLIALFWHRIEIAEDTRQAPTRRVQDLVNLLTQAETKQTQMEKEVSSLRKRLVLIQQHPGGETPAITDPEYEKLRTLAGLTEVEGPGVEILLADQSNPLKPEKIRGEEKVRNSLQSDDLLKLVNDLRAAGATAISLNGQRIVATTEIVNAGPLILVNQSRITAPVEIRALGKPATLRAALQIPGGILEYLAFFGIKSNVKEVSRLKVPPYTGGLS